jgi:hypothetical protein
MISSGIFLALGYGLTLNFFSSSLFPCLLGVPLAAAPASAVFSSSLPFLRALALSAGFLGYCCWSFGKSDLGAGGCYLIEGSFGFFGYYLSGRGAADGCLDEESGILSTR